MRSLNAAARPACLAVLAVCGVCPGQTPTSQKSGKSPAALWGPARDGLQAGIAITSTSRGVAVGAAVPYACYIRNRTKQPIAFSFTQSIYEADRDIPAVYDAQGTGVAPGSRDLPRVRGRKVVGGFFTGLEGAWCLILPPGDTVEVPPYKLFVGKAEGALLDSIPYLEDTRPGRCFLVQSFRYLVMTAERARNLAARARAKGAIVIEPCTVHVKKRDGAALDLDATLIPASPGMKTLSTGAAVFRIEESPTHP